MSSKVNLFILGVQKCGTTTLSDLINAHPQGFVPSIKETYFFALDDKYENGTDWYEQEFYSTARAQAAAWRCDATPFYLASDEAMQRVADYADPDAKFIVVMRDPVKRAISAYNHQIRLGNEPLPLPEALEAEPSRIDATRAEKGRWWRHAYVEVGQYAAHLERAFALLGRERFLVLRQDELSDRAALQARLSAFLDLSEPFPADMATHSNPSSMPRSRLLLKLVTRDNPLKRLAKALLPRELRTKIGGSLNRMNAKPAPHPEVSDDTKAWLAEQFQDDQARLAALGLASHLK